MLWLDFVVTGYYTDGTELAWIQQTICEWLLGDELQPEAINASLAKCQL